jgi:Region found in RelA / SpoT proteins
LSVALVAAEHEVGFLPIVAWAAPAYSRRRVDQAGATYVDRTAAVEDREIARAVINNWRSSHSFPLNTIQVNLRRAAANVDRDPTVAQRIKRLPSIRHKLERFPGMQLSRMQDLGGCRAVLSSVDGVHRVVDYYKSESRMKHRLVREDPYIANPKPSGYRGVHLVYSYYSDRSSTWNGLKIEVQIRSRLQHAWATAVETVGTFTQQALKSSLGEEDWLRFFTLMSSWLATREGTPTVPDTPDNPTTLAQELRRYARSLDVVERLAAYGQALRYAEQQMETMRGGHTFLLELNIPERTLLARTYADSLLAAEEYSAVERAIEGDPTKDAVLVSVESLATLRRAYPNYFLDTSAFLESVREAIAT